MAVLPTQANPARDTKSEDAIKNVSALTKYFGSFGIDEDKEYFLETLNMLLSSGTDVLTAVSIVHNDVRAPYMKHLMENMKDDIGIGMSI